MSPGADPVAQELQTARQLRLHGLLADAEPVGDLGVAQAVDQPQSAHYGSFGGELGEGSFHGGNQLRRLQVGLDLDRCCQLTDPPSPPAGHGGTLQAVAGGVAHGEVEVVSHRAGGDPVRPAAPDPEKDIDDDPGAGYDISVRVIVRRRKIPAVRRRAACT